MPRRARQGARPMDYVCAKREHVFHVVKRVLEAKTNKK